MTQRVDCLDLSRDHVSHSRLRQRRARGRFSPWALALEDRTLLSLQSTITAITASAAVANPGQSVSFTATVAGTPPGSGTPAGGTVTFSDNGVPLGTQSLVNGVATLTT